LFAKAALPFVRQFTHAATWGSSLSVSSVSDGGWEADRPHTLDG
jgi:hypothetical protein